MYPIAADILRPVVRNCSNTSPSSCSVEMVARGQDTLIDTIAFLYAVMLYLGQCKQAVLTITAFSFSGVIYDIFSVFLKIPLPESIL